MAIVMLIHSLSALGIAGMTDRFMKLIQIRPWPLVTANVVLSLKKQKQLHLTSFELYLYLMALSKIN